jgi:hypothetical protein
MLKVTADIFSGRPNPQWVVSGENEAVVLQNLSASHAVAAMDSGFQALAIVD